MRAISNMRSGHNAVPVQLPHVQLVNGEHAGHAQRRLAQVARAQPFRHRLQQDQPG